MSYATPKQTKELQARSFTDVLTFRAAETPDRIVYRFLDHGEEESGRLSYQQLKVKAQAIAARLKSAAGTGKRAILLYPSGLEYVAAMYGCLYSGTIAIPAYPPKRNKSDERLQQIISDAAPEFVLTSRKVHEELDGYIERLVGPDCTCIITDEVPEDLALEWQGSEITENDIALLQYSSGSVSSPRGVMITHGNLLENSRRLKDAFGYDHQTVCVSWLPFFHDMGLIGGVLQPVHGDFPCILMSPMAFLESPYRWLRAISRYRATLSGAPNFAYDLCAQVKGEEQTGLDLSSWAVAFNGAEPVRSATLKRFADAFGPCGFRASAFLPCYGLAEATLLVSGKKKQSFPRELAVVRAELSQNRILESTHAGAEKETQVLVGCGLPANAQEVIVVDPNTSTPRQQGEVGEIWVSGPSVAAGYWNRPEETQRSFQSRLANSGKGPYLRTGDLGFLDQGELVVTGRLKDIIIIGGRNYYPQDIEATSESSHPLLRQGAVAAFAVEEADKERVVILQEVKRRHSKDALPEMIAAIRRAVAEKHEVYPDTVAIVSQGSVLKTSSGKVRRSACRNAFLQGKLNILALDKIEEEEIPSLPRSSTSWLTLSREDLQQALGLLLQKQIGKLLGAQPETISADATLANLGVDSLGAIQLKRALEAQTGIPLETAHLFQPVSLNVLAALIAEQISYKAHAPVADRDDSVQRSSGLELVPLSYGQEQLWLLQKLNPAGCAYNESYGIRITGRLSEAALRRSLLETVQRHEVLRTIILETENGPKQSVSTANEFDMPLVDIGDSAEAFSRSVTQFSREPFDLAAGPLLRTRLLRLGEQEHVLVLVLHHMICDGWSLGVLDDELSALYQAYSRNEIPQLAPLPVQYRDYAVWQRKRLGPEVLEDHLRYWRRQLDGMAVPELTADFLRRGDQSDHGANENVHFGTSLTEELVKMSRQEGVTLFVTVLATFKLLIARYTGQWDVAVGSPVANRGSEEIEKLIGLFMNVLVLRTQFDPQQTFQQALLQTRDTTFEAYPHGALPFGLLVEDLAPGRHLSRNPLFQVLFVFRNAEPKLLLDRLQAEVQPIENGTAKFDLSIYVEENSAGLEARLEYNTDLFQKETIQRLSRNWKTLMESAVAAPECVVSDLPLLSQEEHQQVVVEWNRTRREYGRKTGLHELFAEQVKKTPEAVALKHGGVEVSYEELNQKANRLGHYLRRQGVGPEVRVGICLERGVDLVVGMLGILKAGGAYVPLDAGYPAERLRMMVEDAELAVVLSRRQHEGLFAGGMGKKVWLEEAGEEIGKERGEETGVRVEAENLAYVIYTSGSTGKPKGVGITHGSAWELMHWAREEYREEELSGVLASTSICFDLSVYEIFAPLSWGGKVVLVENALELAESEGREEVRVINTVPSAMRELVRMGGVPGGVKTVNLAGEALGEALVEEIYGLEQVERVMNLYGPTEDTTYSTYVEVGRKGEKVTIGVPLSNSQAYVLDEEMRAVPVGVKGELWLGGAGLARGYWRRPEMTAERFRPNPYGEAAEGERIYRTGDHARWNGEGRLEYVGRKDQQVKVRGYRIELGEIEAVLNEKEGVEETVVVVRERASGEKGLVGYVVMKEGEKSQGSKGGRGRESDLKEWLRRRVPEYMVPGVVVELKEMPRTTTGKVDRKGLPEVRWEAGEGGEQGKAKERGESGDAGEEIVRGIFAEALERESVGREENFFALGGHSLLATQVVARVRKVFGVEMPLRAMFETPTVAGIAERLREERRAGGEGERVAPVMRRVDRERPLPLSYAQQRLWFLDQLVPDSAFYNISAAIGMKGNLNVSALRSSLKTVVQRHEALRTRFDIAEGQPVQVVSSAEAWELKEVDLSHLGMEREEIVKKLAEEEAMRPFQLDQGGLFRATLLNLGDAEHVLLLTVHHIVSDGWSMRVLVEEVSRLYESIINGEENPLPELAVQYADYSFWQREWLQGDVLDQQLNYWRKKLDGPPLALPLDRERPVVSTYQGGQEVRQFSRDLSRELKQLSRDYDATLFMVLMAGYQLMLQRYTGQDSIAVGTPVANRTRQEIEPLIGFFVNMLVLRTTINVDLSVEDFLKLVREESLAAYDHQDLPFEKLVEELAPERDPGINPLFQVVLNLQNALNDIRLPGLELAMKTAQTQTARFDLTLMIEEKDSTLNAILDYNADIFEPNTMERMLGHFETLLQGMVNDPSRAVHDLPMLSQAEREQILVEWNHTEIQISHENCIPQLFAAQVKRAPDSPALICGDTRMNYGELDGKSSQLANHLRALGVGPETAVGVLTERSPETIVTLLGILKAGGAYVPLDPSYPQERLDLLVADANVKVIVTAEHLAGLVARESGPVIVCVDSDEAQIGRHSAIAPAVELSADNLAYITYTSGSTGVPKGVAVTHRAVVRLVDYVNGRDFQPQEAMLQFAPLAFDASTFEIWGCLLNGGQLVIVPEERPTLEELARVIQEFDVTTLWLTSGLFHLMVDHQPEALQNVRQLWAGGDVVSATHVQKFLDAAKRASFINGYGPTENTTFTCCYQTHEPSNEGTTVPIGRPITGTQVYIVSPQMQLVPVGAVGEMYIGGAGLARSYVGRADLTAEKFIPNPFSSEPGARMYRSGDLARFRQDGNVEFLGRADRQVKVRGFRIELGEIEAVLRAQSGVRDAVVVARGEGSDKRLVAYVVPDRSGDVEISGSDQRELWQASLKKTLPDYMVPGVWVQMEYFPLTVNGKVDHKALPEPGRTENEYVAPRTPVEEALAAIWTEILKIECPGVKDNFFELGGHSLLATQLISRAQKTFQIQFSVRQLFEQPTIEGMAQHVVNSRPADDEPELVPISREGYADWNADEAHKFPGFLKAN